MRHKCIVCVVGIICVYALCVRSLSKTPLYEPHCAVAMQAFINTAREIYRKIQDGVFDVSNEVSPHWADVGYEVWVFCFNSMDKQMICSTSTHALLSGPPKLLSVVELPHRVCVACHQTLGLKEDCHAFLLRCCLSSASRSWSKYW